MDTSFDKVQRQFNIVDESMEAVEEIPFYTEESAWDLEHSAQALLESIKVWRHQHGDTTSTGEAGLGQARGGLD